MAVHTFYVIDTNAVSPGFFGNLQDGGTAPTAANCLALANCGKLAINSFCAGQLAGASSGGNNSTPSATSLISGKTSPTAGTAATPTAIGDSWITPTTLSGSFPSGNWTITAAMRASSGAYQGMYRLRVWRSANADGSGATEITTAIQNGTVSGVMSTTATTTSVITWAAPLFSVTSEYLFFQVEFEEQTSGGSSNTGKWALRAGESTIVTTNLGAAAAAPFMFPRNRHYIRR